ncbi:MAG: radical SAM protein [Candidatus Buchananbacteria bacterium]|nr:radical SAM protein [Candidatus Buchananbacteria bacterium]
MNILNQFIRRLFYLPPAYPQTIQIGITNICNFKCPMCQRFDLKVNLQHMDFDLFKKIIARIDASQCSDLILTGWGEPLCHPQFLDMVLLAKDKGFKIRFTSNGSLLDEHKINFLLEQNIEAVTFSIDELESNDKTIGHKLAGQLANIKKLIQLRNQLGKQTQIYFQTTYPQKGEDNILKIIDYAEKIGVDRVKISRLDIRFQQFARPSSQEEKIFVKQLENYTKNKRVQVDFLPYLAFNGFARQIYKKVYPWLHRRGKFCLRTLADLYINVKGQATPCCALPRCEIGDTLNKEINELWHSVDLKRFRINQKKVCGACDILEINYKG